MSAQATVTIRYVLHSQWVVVETRGWSFPNFKPVLSAEKSCCSPTPRAGSRARVKKMMPMPPIQCIRLRQKRMEWGRPSMWSRAVAPVVVKPDIDSKKATATRSVTPPVRKGIMPKRQ